VYIASCSGNVCAVDLATGKLAWEYPVDPDGGTQFHGNPALVGDLILFGTDQGFGERVGSLYALDRRTGEARWHRRIDPGLPSDLEVDGSFVLGVTLDDRVVSVNWSDGEVRWQSAGSATEDPDVGMYEDIRGTTLASSCVVSRGRACLAGRDQTVRGLNAETGELVWSVPAAAGITTRLSASDSELVFGSADYNLNYLDRESGKVLRTQRMPLIPQEAMQWRDGRIYFLGGFEDARPEDVLSVDAQTGDVLWHARIPDTSANAYWYVPRLHFWDGSVIVGSTHGLVVAYDEITGDVRWQKRLEAPIRGIGSSGDMLLVGNFDGTLFALRRPAAGR